MTTRPDASSRKPRQQSGAISTVLTNLRRRVQRGSRDVIETAVAQLFDAAVHPHGVAASIQAEAWAWTWQSVEGDCDLWSAQELTGLAEEVLKLRTALRTGAETTASVQRSLLALRLAKIVAVRRRVLYGSENRLWDEVSAAMGTEWESAQRHALGLDEATWEQSCRAALDLYALAAEELAPLLDHDQRAVLALVGAD